tara:strand:+ start:6190 stop:6870 length:681 start_codon:yes stop_codon:yes gene_type:complete
MKNKDFSIIIPSNNFKIQEEIYQHIVFELAEEDKRKVTKFNGADYPSFSKLLNDCIVSTKTEVVIICSDRCLPYKHDIDNTLNLIEAGYGVVGLYRFGFFGFTKHLIEKIGFFDEKYVGGGFEDCDFMRRLREANIAYYEREQVWYRPGPSRWPLDSSFEKNKTYFEAKWHEDNETIKRLKPEPHLDYNLGETPAHNFLPWKYSTTLPPSEGFRNKKFINGEKNVF